MKFLKAFCLWSMYEDVDSFVFYFCRVLCFKNIFFHRKQEAPSEFRSKINPWVKGRNPAKHRTTLKLHTLAATLNCVLSLEVCLCHTIFTLINIYEAVFKECNNFLVMEFLHCVFVFHYMSLFFSIWSIWFLPGVLLKDIEASVVNPSFVSEVCQVNELEAGHFAIVFVPQEIGVHRVNVRHCGKDIPGLQIGLLLIWTQFIAFVRIYI